MCNACVFVVGIVRRAGGGQTVYLQPSSISKDIWNIPVSIASIRNTVLGSFKR